MTEQQEKLLGMVYVGSAVSKGVMDLYDANIRFAYHGDVDRNIVAFAKECGILISFTGVAVDDTCNSQHYMIGEVDSIVIKQCIIEGVHVPIAYVN